MKPFNLAEARIIERNYCQAHVNKRLRIITLMAVLTIVVVSGSLVCKSMFAGSVHRTQNHLAEAKARCDRAKSEIASVNVGLYERKWQEQLASESGRWLSLLQSALGSVPADVRLDSIKNSDKDLTLAVSGRAVSLDSITLFINALRSNQLYTEVRLESAKITDSSSGTYVDFTLVLTPKENKPTTTADSTGNALVGQEPSVNTSKSPGSI